jgi:predicted protein tyrosine phosphatase
LGQRTWGLLIFIFGQLATQRWQKIFSEQIEKLFLICSDFFFENILSEVKQFLLLMKQAKKHDY